jgi:hypothetical protein
MKSYICECCNKEWKTLPRYRAHMNTKKNTGGERKKRTHKNELIIWKCEICNDNKIFKNKANFLNHCMIKKRFNTHENYVKQFL